jgi:hypothetical protein
MCSWVHYICSDDEGGLAALNDHDDGPGKVGLDDSTLFAMGQRPAMVLKLNLVRRVLWRETLWPDDVARRVSCGRRGCSEADEKNDSG